MIHLWIKRSLKLGGKALYGGGTNPSTFPGLKPGVCSAYLPVGRGCYCTSTLPSVLSWSKEAALLGPALEGRGFDAIEASIFWGF